MLLVESNKNVLKSTRLFSKAGDPILNSIVGALEVIHVGQGEAVFVKGDRGSAMYVVKEGKVRVHDGDMVFNHLTRGDIFGEMATLDDDVRSASITAEVDSVLLRLDQKTLHDLIVGQPEISMAMISSLCHSLRDRVQDLTNDYVHIKTLERELEIGREIQSSFLPERLPCIDGWQIAAYFKGARECAGDFYDVFEMGKSNRIALVIGDVCDKGVGAALFMTLFRSLIRASATSGHSIDWGDISPAGAADPTSQQLLKSVRLTNDYVAQTHGNSSMFASLFFGMLDPDKGSLVYANCGHEAPMVVNSDGVKALLDVTGPVVGIFRYADFRVQEIELEPGDTLLAFTDGVPEAMNSHGERFGNGRLHRLLAVPQPSAGTLLERITAELQNFADGASQSDDITILAARWVPASDLHPVQL
jgi:sigma-B regulation protein RsbU (phosphoserine phosphatase)